MKTHFKNSLNNIRQLSTKEKEKIKDILVDLIFKDKNTFEAKSIEYHLESCPYCSSKEFKKNGKNSNNIQTYRCKDCFKYSSSTTGSAIFRIQKKEKWYQYIELLFSGKYYSVRESASIIEVNPNTTFTWRHKILTAINLNPKKFNGIVEMDDLHYKFSQKGRRGLVSPNKRGNSNKGPGDNNLSVKILASMDRVNSMKLDVVRVGRLKSIDINAVKTQDLLDNQSNILTSDKHASIGSFAKSEEIKHETFLAKNHSKNKIFHVNTLNEVAKRINEMINRKKKGVATKYLQNYTNWFKLVELRKYMELDFFDMSFKSNLAWDTFNKREENYRYFLLFFSNIAYTPLKTVVN